MFVGDYKKAKAQAQANANRSGRNWVVFDYGNKWHAEPQSSGPSGAQVVKPKRHGNPRHAIRIGSVQEISPRGFKRHGFWSGALVKVDKRDGERFHVTEIYKGQSAWVHRDDLEPVDRSVDDGGHYAYFKAKGDVVQARRILGFNPRKKFRKRLNRGKFRRKSKRARGRGRR